MNHVNCHTDGHAHAETVKLYNSIGQHTPLVDPVYRIWSLMLRREMGIRLTVTKITDFSFFLICDYFSENVIPIFKIAVEYSKVPSAAESVFLMRVLLSS